MSPHRALSHKTHRQPTTIQDIFLGIAFSLAPSSDGKSTRNLEYTCVLHDGTGVTESETFNHEFRDADDEQGKTAEAKKVSQEVLKVMRKIQTEKKTNVSHFLALIVRVITDMSRSG